MKLLFTRISKTPIGRGLYKAARGLGTHTYTHVHILVFFSYKYRGALLWRLHKAPLYKELCEALIERGFIMGASQSSYREELCY